MSTRATLVHGYPTTAYSESQFKTLKYHHDFPGTFESDQHAREFLGPFIDWYNFEHKHSGIALLSSATVHHGDIAAVLARRQATLDAAYERVPERFARPPVAKAPPSVVHLGPQNAAVIELAITGSTSIASTTYQEAM